MQKSFREDLSLIVDVTKVGFGNSNDGNTAHRAFGNPEEFLRITGVDQDLICRLKNLLSAVCSG